MKTFREMLRIRPRGQHRRFCPCSGAPMSVKEVRPGQKWECPDCGQKYVAELLSDHYGRYVRWLIK